MEKTIHDIIQWDVTNWSQALKYWDPVIRDSVKLNCLEIGGNKGGLSLYAAIHGHRVICSDLKNPEENAKPLHAKYDVKHLISYEEINCLDIPYENQFDVIFLKSTLPSLGLVVQTDLQQNAIDQIYKSLQKGGSLLFAENISGSLLHKFARKNFVKWGSRVRYSTREEFLQYFRNFSKVEFQEIGFFGTFGRTEKQRRFLSKIDNQLEPFIPKSWKYLIVGVATK